MFCIAATSTKNGLTKRALAIFGSVCADGSESPSRFLARIRHTYAAPVRKSGNTACNFLTSDSMNDFHCEAIFSLYSTMYPVIGEPPSESGAFH